MNYLFEHIFSFILFESPSLFHKLQQITTTGILHHHKEVLGALKHLKQSDDI